jgi:hypothetical protein
MICSSKEFFKIIRPFCDVYNIRNSNVFLINEEDPDPDKNQDPNQDTNPDPDPK